MLFITFFCINLSANSDNSDNCINIVHKNTKNMYKMQFSSIYTHKSLVPSKAEIQDANKLSEIYAFLRKVWNVESLSPNPCALPVSLERKDLDMLVQKKNEYAVSEKTDGVRYILALGKYSNGDPFSVMLNRNLEPFEISVIARDDVFTGGTVMDGELIWEYYSSIHPPRQLYVIFDSLLHCGIDVQTANYIERLEIINNVFYVNQNDLQYSRKDWIEIAYQFAEEKKIVSLGNAHNLSFSCKSCYSIDNIDMLVRNWNTFNHSCDGLLFTPIHDRVRRGRHRQMFKWKTNHTVDVLLRLSRDNVSNHHWNIEILLSRNKDVLLYNTCGAELTFLNKKVNFSITRGKFLRSMLAHLETKNITFHEVLVEAVLQKNEDSCCDESSEISYWNLEPVILRNDKRIPNAFETVERTLGNISEAISLPELVDILKTK